ncbi:MAG: hypothetical protein SAK29_25110 [Scytonema sp. PMC 1069.18]|nr:hypothetical protein [Scytonema sp. PMC 1069.18]MEC4887998.1 hypothetical protein [Scytonema sp. PMC 1070.18]
MFKRLLFLLICAVGGFGAVFLFFWYQVTQLPSWYVNVPSQYTHSSSEVASTPSITDQEQKQVVDKIAERLKSLNAQGEVQLDANEVNTLIASNITQTTDTSTLAQAIKSTNTQIKNGKIATGAVIDLSAVPFNKLHPDEQAVVSKLLSTVPILKYRPIYIELEGKPSIHNKKVTLDDTTRIKLGNISFPLSEMSQRLGFSEEHLTQQVSRGLSRLPMEGKDVEIVGDRLVVRSSSRS